LFKRLCQLCRREITEDESVELKKEDDRYLCDKCAFILVEKYRTTAAIIETEFNYA
jgi:predicted SprT family Zn-dependent metalloprotease